LFTPSTDGAFTHIRRINMNSLIAMKILSRRLLLISAATLVTANTVVAANRVGDALMQARDLLTGTVEGAKATDRSSSNSADLQQRSYPEPQEQARQLILGKPSFEGPASRKAAALSKTNAAAPASARRKDRDDSDPQELARRMILGEGDSSKERARVRLSAIQ
jgi:hypothetical protein